MAGVSDERRVELEQQLVDVQAELAEISKQRLSFTASMFDPLREKSEELEATADRIRNELGAPAAQGRPPRADGRGWALVAASAVAIVAAIWFFMR
ncbi:hypothetical protein [Microbacterium sp. NPDC090014]|uniref:hypothetical protein n=1 Tax=Microbacterium sp. NPDC090014 TaxID=3364205 RepID=UPI00380C24B4